MKMKHNLLRYGLAVLLFCITLPIYAYVPSQYVDKNGYPVYPTPNISNGTDKDLILRGEYLAKAGDCIACHSDSKHGEAPYAGGLGIKTPFGTFYTPNITPDKETGIGNWTDAQFIKAMREGVAPDGSNYFPVFPYVYFNRVTDQDLLAIKAYLFSLPAVYRPNTPNDVLWPISWRFPQWGWKLLFFTPYKGVYQYDAHQTPEWNRGAYLVQGLGHCAMCHSPLNLLGAVKKGYELTGGFVDGYYAPDISTKGLTGEAIDDIIDVFVKNEMLRGAGQVQGPMLEVNYDSLHYLTPEDLKAIAVYLKTVKSKEMPQATASAIGPNTGKEIYDDHCAVCHGSGAAGAPKLGDANAWAPRLAQGMDVLLQHAINGYNSMPPKGTCMSCSDDQIKAAVQYLADQSKSGAAAAAPKSYMPTQPPLTMAQGKLIYDQHCSICHNTGKYDAPIIGDKDTWSPLIAQNMDILFEQAIDEHNNLPEKNNCSSCSEAEIIAATKYLVQQSAANGNYSLW